MKISSTMPAWAQWVLGIFIAVLCLSAGVASLGMNVIFGLQFSPIMGAIFGLSDVLKIALPAVAVVLGWQWKTKLLYVGAALFSVFCALNYLAETQGNTLLEAKHRAAMISAARQDAESAKAQLAEIDELLGSDELKDLHTQKTDAVSRETARGGCGPKCESIQKEADALLVRLGKAKRREELEAKVDEATKLLKATPEKTVGSVGIISALTGIGKEQIGTSFTIGSSLFALFLLELTAMLSSYGMAMLRSAYTISTKTVKTRARQTVTVDEVGEPVKMTKEIALHKVQMRIFHSPGKMLVSSRRALAEELGVAKSTFNDWCNEWQDAGLVITTKRGNETVFAAQEAA